MRYPYPMLTRCLALLALASCATPSVDVISVRTNEGTALSFDISPDGRTIAMDLLGQLWQLEAAGGRATPLTDAVRDTAEDADPAWSPDGSQLVFRGERHGRTGLWMLHRDSTRPRQLTQLEQPDGYDGRPAWSPDGSTIAFVRAMPPDSAFARWRSRIALVDAAGGSVSLLEVDARAGRNLRDPAWSPDGARLAFVGSSAQSDHGGRLWMLERASGVLQALTDDGTLALAPAFSPDGLSIAYLAPDSAGRTQVWTAPLAAPERRTKLTSDDDLSPTRVRWLPDGRALMYTSDGRLRTISSSGSDPSEIPFSAQLTIARRRPTLPPARFPEPGERRHIRSVMSSAIAHDGTRIVMAALGHLWIMPVSGRPESVAEIPLGARHLAWAPDGRSIAWSAGAWDEEDIFVTDVSSGMTVPLVRFPGRQDHPMYSPDGRFLAFLDSPVEDSTVLRVIDVAAPAPADRSSTRDLGDVSGADVTWSPASDALLAISGGFAPGEATIGQRVPLSGERHPLTGVPDSPLFPSWAAGYLYFVRHARLWRSRFVTADSMAAAEPLGESPATYPSVADDGTLLFVSGEGLRIRTADGRERTLGWPLPYTPPVPPPLLIRNARIIDGTGTPPSEPKDVMVRGGRIVDIATGGSARASGATILDAGGGFLIPGLVDLHAHIYRPELLRGYPWFGITTIRDQGSPVGPLVAYADAIAAGYMDGPRVDYGGIQFYTDWGYDLEDGQGVEPEADSGHVRRAIALARAFGSLHIKTRTFRRWDINARLIEEAHRWGMRTTGHCSHLLPLVEAGMDAKEHAGFCESRTDGRIHQDLLQLYRAAGIAVIPTISYASLAVEVNQDPDVLERDTEIAPFLAPPNTLGWMVHLDSARRAQFSGYSNAAQAASQALVRAGVRVGTGTDIWQDPSGVHRELQELVRAGLTPLEALRAATADAARIIGAEAEIGTVGVGKDADLVLLDADPSDDIRNTRRIRAVIQAGRLLDRSAQARH